MKNQKKLSREEMKKVVGGTNKTWWACDTGGGFISNVCSSTNPSSPTCTGITCTNTGVTCSATFGCP